MISNNNLRNVQMSSSNASLKVVGEGSSSVLINVFSGATFGSGLAVIPHDGATDQLIWQVSMFSNLETAGNNVPTPYQSDDDRTLLHSYVDKDNLYVEAAYSSSSGDLTPFTIAFFYRILLP